MIVFLLLYSTAMADSSSEDDGEEKEMIEMLDMLVNYDELISDDLYEYLENNRETSADRDDAGDKEDGGIR